MKKSSLNHRIAAVLICAAAIAGIMTGCGNKIEHTVNANADQGNNTAEEAKAEAPSEELTSAEESTENTEPVEFDYTLCFSGDVCASDSAYTTAYWKSNGEDITKCIDETMVSHMQSADICFVNNEFPYSLRGSAIPYKDYTYRGNPENVKILKDLGVDIVSLANNHMFDYGEEALLDTLETLDNAGIKRVGAGKDLEEASSIYYYDLEGLKVAFISGTRVEWQMLTREAAENQPGVFRTVDPTLLYERVKEAKENADYVVVYMHWGIEGVTYLEDYQLTTGNGLIDAGADAVIGDHTHCLQGIDFYKGKPIVYSLGNYWFNGKTMDTMLAELHITGTKDNISTELKIVPAVQSGCQVKYIETPYEQESFYNRMISMSYGISIDKNGVVSDAD